MKLSESGHICCHATHLLNDRYLLCSIVDAIPKKNDKVQQWRIKLASFFYVIQYRPGQQNVGSDTFTRDVCATNSDSLSSLQDLHEKLCHLGITRMLHFVRTKNLPFSTTDVKRVVASCKICAEVKPVFLRQESGVLIKST